MHIWQISNCFPTANCWESALNVEKITFFLSCLPGKSQINSDSIFQAYFALSWHLQQEFKAQSFRVAEMKRNWTRGSWSPWRLMALQSLIHIPLPKTLQWASPLLDKTQEGGKCSKTWILPLKPPAVTGDTTTAANAFGAEQTDFSSSQTLWGRRSQGDGTGAASPELDPGNPLAGVGFPVPRFT